MGSVAPSLGSSSLEPPLESSLEGIAGLIGSRYQRRWKPKCSMASYSRRKWETAPSAWGWAQWALEAFLQPPPISTSADMLTQHLTASLRERQNNPQCKRTFSENILCKSYKCRCRIIY